MYRETTLDIESTTFQKGNPFSRRNRLCSVGLLSDSIYVDFPIEYDSSPYGNYLQAIQEVLNNTELLIGFNIKFDIHWIRRYGISIDRVHSVWDCQLAYFVLDYQSKAYPSLNDALDKYGLPNKLDRVANEFWSQGIDTPEIPWDILAEYQEADVRKTYEVYLKQKEEFEKGDPRLYEMFKLQCKDLLILEDMEFYGMKLDVSKAKEKELELQSRLLSIDEELGKIADSRINWSSSDAISVFLYGGSLYFKVRERAQRVLKNGTIKEYERWGTEKVDYVRRVKPLDRTESSTTANLSDQELQLLNVDLLRTGRKPVQRLYSVDEQTLRGLKTTGKIKRVIELLLERSELDKLHGTYYKGLQDIITEMDWPDEELHGQFNQCVVVTSRLSSSKPNLQNLAGETKILYVSKYN